MPEAPLIDTPALVIDRDVARAQDHGLIVGHPEAAIVRVIEEQGMVELPAGPRRRRVVQVVPNHVCPVVNLHDGVTVSRGGQPRERRVVAARGRSS